MVLAALGALGLAVYLAVLTARGRRVPAPAWLVGPVLVCGLGVLGVWTGLGLAFEPHTVSAWEHPFILISAGLAISHHVGWLGWFLAGVLLLVEALVLAWASRRAPPDSRLRATARATVLLLAPLGLGSLAVVRQWAGRILFWEELSHSWSDPLGVLLTAGEPLWGLDGPGLFLAGGVLVLGGSTALWPVRAWLVDRRSLLGALGSLVLVSALAWPVHLRDERVVVLEESIQPRTLQRAGELQALGVELAPSRGQVVPGHELRLVVAPGLLALDGARLDPEVELVDGIHRPLFLALDEAAAWSRRRNHWELGPRTGYGLVVEASSELRWTELRPLLDTAVGTGCREICLAGTCDGAVVCRQVRLRGPLYPEAGTRDEAIFAREGGYVPTFTYMLTDLISVGPSGSLPLELVVEEESYLLRLGNMERDVADPSALPATLLELRAAVPDSSEAEVEVRGDSTASPSSTRSTAMASPRFGPRRP